MPQAPGVAYADLYGLQVFTCTALRATLQPRHCAERWRRPESGSACQGCTIGAAHAGQTAAPPPIQQAECCRCGRTGQRLLAKSICVSCHNRAREVVVRRNGKGCPPILAAARLRNGYAIASCPDADLAIREMMKRHPSGNGAWQTGLRTNYLPGLPRIERLDGAHIWISAVCTDTGELKRVIDRLLPTAEITDCEIGPTFAEQWADSP